MFPPLLLLLLTSSSPSIAGEPDKSRKAFIIEAVSVTGRIARPEIEIFNARPSSRLPAFTGEDLHPNAVNAYRDYTNTIQQLKELNQASSALSLSLKRLSRAYTGQLNPPAEIPIAPALPNTLHEHLTAVADDSSTVRTLLDVDAAKSKAKTMAADGESLAKLMEWLRGDWQRPLQLQRTIQSEQQGPSRRMLLDILQSAERPLAAHELVLLGRLLDEQAHEAFLDAIQKYEQLELGLVGEPPEFPRRDHTAMLDVCKTFEKTFGTDNVLYPDILLLETAARMDINSNSYAEEKTEGLLRLLMAKESYAALKAWAAFSLGEYLFEHYRVDEAAQVYADLLETLEPDDRHYPATMYKLMWSQFRQGRHDAQLQTAARYLRWAPTGDSNYLEPEVIRYSALAIMSLRDLDVAKHSPVSDLQAFDKRLGTGAPLRSIAVDLAEVFTQTAQYTKAVEVVEYLYQTWPMHPDSPNQVWRAARLYRALSPPNEEKSLQALQVLKEKYHEKSDWWRANRHNQSAIEQVEEYLEEVLASQATDSHDARSSEHAESIRSVVRRKKSQVQYCYEKRLKENPNLGGRLAIMVDIVGGRVTQVRIEENTTGDKELEGCVKSKVQRWRFSPETTASIVLPFALSAE